MKNRTRVQCFVDGFNLYHAIHNLQQPHLKWFNLRQLMEVFTDPDEHELLDVFYFSAFANWLPGPLARHREYVKAINSLGTTPVMGHFKEKDRICKKCQNSWKAHEEKETDVNIAIWLLREAFKDNFDEAFIVSRDSDLTPVLRMVAAEFPKKTLKVISPPNAGHSKEMAKIVGKNKLASIKLIHLERSLLSKEVIDPKTKQIIANRPSEYCPPPSR